MIPKEISARLRKGDTMCKRFDDWSQEKKTFATKMDIALKKQRVFLNAGVKTICFYSILTPIVKALEKGWDCLTKHLCLLFFISRDCLMADFYLSRQNTLKNILRSFFVVKLKTI